MADKVKEGDIVFVEGEDASGKLSVIGKVVSYNEQTDVLVLGWPEKLSPYNSANTLHIYWHESTLKHVKVLSNEEIFEMLLKLRFKDISNLKEDYQKAAAAAANRYLHI